MSWNSDYFQDNLSKLQSPKKAKLSVVGSHEDEAIYALRRDREFLQRLKHCGMPWRGVQERLHEELPGYVFDRDNVAFNLVSHAMNAIFGQQESAWYTEKRPSKSKRSLTTWIVIRGDLEQDRTIELRQ